jgi:DNA-directed RNA polymerase specialized sigma24 family protein
MPMNASVRRASFSVEDYTSCAGTVPPKRRAGARPGELSAEFRAALAQEAERLEQAGTPVEVIRGVGDAFAALDEELAQFAAVRLRAVEHLRGEGWTYARISKATGLSEARVAQLVRASRNA